MCDMSEKVHLQAIVLSTPFPLRAIIKGRRLNSVRLFKGAEGGPVQVYFPTPRSPRSPCGEGNFIVMPSVSLGIFLAGPRKMAA